MPLICHPFLYSHTLACHVRRRRTHTLCFCSLTLNNLFSLSVTEFRSHPLTSRLGSVCLFFFIIPSPFAHFVLCIHCSLGFLHTVAQPHVKHTHNKPRLCQLYLYSKACRWSRCVCFFFLYSRENKDMFL